MGKAPAIETQFFENSNIFYPCQYGFNTIHAVLDLLDETINCYEN